MSATGVPRVASLLQRRLRSDEWSAADDARARFACDAFHEFDTPAAILAPRSVTALAEVLPELAAAGVAVVPVGASLSYSAGSILEGRDWVAVDMRHLDAVLEVNSEDRWVSVQSGCNWAALREHLAAKGLRTPFWGPASGLVATVGGTVSNDGIFFGSGTHGASSGSVLGLTVLLADGSLLYTGIHVTGHGLGAGQVMRALPFGPDLTPLFIGACGAFGIIVELSLRVIEDPRQQAFAGFQCASVDIVAATLAALARADVAAEAIVLDPSVTTLLLGQAPTEFAAPGRAHAPGAAHSMSVAVESTHPDDARLRLQSAITACESAGARHDGEGLLQAWHHTPFSPPAMLRDGAGNRWVPVHGIVPHSRVAAAIEALDRALRANAELVAELALRWSYTCALVGAGAVLVEANLYWKEPGNALVDSYLGCSDAADPQRVAGVRRLREALVKSLDVLEATHLQIGRIHPYLSRLDPVARRLVLAIKASVDPQSIMNPGVLQLGSGSSIGT